MREALGRQEKATPAKHCSCTLRECRTNVIRVRDTARKHNGPSGGRLQGLLQERVRALGGKQVTACLAALRHERVGTIRDRAAGLCDGTNLVQDYDPRRTQSSHDGCVEAEEEDDRIHFLGDAGFNMGRPRERQQ
jgi:hypothetical protein